MELPVVVGLHVCERIEVDPMTRHVTLVNRLSTLRAGDFPAEISFAVFGVFVDGFGMLAFRIEIEQLSTGLVIHEFPTMVEFTDRLREVEFILRLSEILFWYPGEYDVSLTVDGEPLTKCKIMLLDSGGTNS